MDQAQLEKLFVAADLKLQRDMAGLAEIERARRALQSDAEKYEAATRAVLNAESDNVVAGSDLLYAEKARNSARRKLRERRAQITRLNDGPRAAARDRVRKALAKKSVIEGLIEDMRRMERKK